MAKKPSTANSAKNSAAKIESHQLPPEKLAAFNDALDNPDRVIRGNPDKTIPYRFQPGQSGNLSGRPKSKRLTAGYIRVLEREAETGETGADEIAEAMYKAAKTGDVRAATHISDRTEGKPVQALKIEGSIEHLSADDQMREVIAALAARARASSAAPDDGGGKG